MNGYQHLRWMSSITYPSFVSCSYISTDSINSSIWICIHIGQPLTNQTGGVPEVSQQERVTATTNTLSLREKTHVCNELTDETCHTLPTSLPSVNAGGKINIVLSELRPCM